MYNFQSNPQRFGKRPTEFKKPKMNQPFDKSKFNFTKIDKSEVSTILITITLKFEFLIYFLQILFEIINDDNVEEINGSVKQIKFD